MFILIAQSRLQSVAAKCVNTKALQMRLCCPDSICLRRTDCREHPQAAASQNFWLSRSMCIFFKRRFSLDLLLCCYFGALGSADNHQSVTKLFAHQVPSWALGIKSHNRVFNGVYKRQRFVVEEVKRGRKLLFPLSLPCSINTLSCRRCNNWKTKREAPKEVFPFRLQPVWEACPVAKQKAFDSFFLPLLYLSALLSTQAAMRGYERIIYEYWSQVICMDRLLSAMRMTAWFIGLYYMEIANETGSATRVSCGRRQGPDSNCSDDK